MEEVEVDVMRINKYNESFTSQTNPKGYLADSFDHPLETAAGVDPLPSKIIAIA